MTSRNDHAKNKEQKSRISPKSFPAQAKRRPFCDLRVVHDIWFHFIIDHQPCTYDENSSTLNSTAVDIVSRITRGNARSKYRSWRDSDETTNDLLSFPDVQTQVRLNGIFGLMMTIGISRHTASTEQEMGAASSL